jgi:hypothetical protein
MTKQEREAQDRQSVVDTQTDRRTKAKVALANWNALTPLQQYAAASTNPVLDGMLLGAVDGYVYRNWEGGGYANGQSLAIPQSLIDNAIASFGGNVPPYVNPPGWPS